MKTNESWRTLYALAADLYKLRPWNFLMETDVFGVLSPGTGIKYFVSIMGSEGTLSALAAYEGTTALGQFWDLEENDIADSGDVLSIPHMIVSFESEDNIDSVQRERFRSIGTDLGFKDEIPEVKRIIPGRFPEDPDESHLQDLILILGQALNVCSRAAHDPDFIHPEGRDEETYLMREQKIMADKTGWNDKYRKIEITPLAYKVTWDRGDIDEIISLPTSQTVMQAHFQMLPLPVKEEGKAGHFPYIVLLTNKKSGRVEGYYMAVPDPDYETMLGSIPKTFLNYIKALGFRPRSIEVKSPLVFEMLHEPLQQCAIRLLVMKNLVTLEKAVQAILESIRKQNKA